LIFAAFFKPRGFVRAAFSFLSKALAAVTQASQNCDVAGTEEGLTPARLASREGGDFQRRQTVPAVTRTIEEEFP
jgi:hypothetical protein